MVYRAACGYARVLEPPCLGDAYAVTRCMQINAVTQYELPANTFKDWAGCERNDYVPTERQKLVVDAVQKALDAGLYYTSDVLEFCKVELRVTEAQAAVAATRVQGGEVGMDIYYGRKYLDKQKQLARAREILELLRPHVGQRLGTIMFNDFKRITGAIITEVAEGGLTMTVQGKRGSATVAFTCNPISVACAIDRAAERMLRKLNFQATFCEGAVDATHEKQAPAKAKAPADELTASLF